MIDFILGGARSGKSYLAEQRAIISEKQVIYIATAQAHDIEMLQRIEHHQQRRPNHWKVIEESHDLAKIIAKYDQSEYVILIDCLTLWMSNLLMLEKQDWAHEQIKAFLAQASKLQCDLIVVSNETGLGVVPMGELTRRFVDETGRLHQQLGKIADRVSFCVAGFPMILKGTL